jgi:hypothetical protein
VPLPYFKIRSEELADNQRGGGFQPQFAGAGCSSHGPFFVRPDVCEWISLSFRARLANISSAGMRVDIIAGENSEADRGDLYCDAKW